MKTKIISITILIVLISSNSLLAASSKIDKRETLAMTNVLPEEFKDYQKKAKGDNGINDAKLTLSLVSDANDLVIKIPDPNKKEDYNRAYCATWILCMDIMKKTKDSEAKKMILEKWNSSLKKDDMSVPFQIYSLATTGWDPNRIFVNEDFWTLLEKTKNKQTISAISFILYLHGNQEDASRLLRKANSGIDKESQNIIFNAVNYMNYRFKGDQTLPGPASLPPIPDFIGEKYSRDK
jgi:hypothetical protein